MGAGDAALRAAHQAPRAIAVCRASGAGADSAVLLPGAGALRRAARFARSRAGPHAAARALARLRPGARSHAQSPHATPTSTLRKCGMPDMVLHCCAPQCSNMTLHSLALGPMPLSMHPQGHDAAVLSLGESSGCISGLQSHALPLAQGLALSLTLLLEH